MSGVELGLAIVATVDLCLKFEPHPNQSEILSVDCLLIYNDQIWGRAEARV